MKFICTQENLSRGLSIVNHVASKNTTLPILNNVLLKIEDGVLKLSTTNLEIGINCLIRGKVESEGSFTVQAKLLSDYVNLLPKEQVELSVTGKAIHIKCGKHETKINGLSADDFPVIPELDRNEVAQVSIPDFKNALSQVIFAVANDETRPEISGVFFDFNQNKAIMVATDSYRLAEKQLTLSKAFSSEHQFIIPSRTLQELNRVLSEGDESEPLSIIYAENQIQFSFGSVELVSRLIDGQYPDYKQIILDNFNSTAVAPKDKFLKSIKGASLFCKIGINDVTLRFFSATNEMSVSSANSQLGEYEAKVESDILGDDNEIVFNYKYVIDGLNAINSDEVELKLLDENTQGLLTAKDKDDYRYIIMPVILN